MSDRQIAKSRWHRGVSAYLRVTLRRVGISLDEEAAQFSLGGLTPLTGQAKEFIEQVCGEALTQRRDLMAAWEQAHPGVNPYPPSFPERALRIVREALTATYTEEGDPAYHLERLRVMCEKELEIDPSTTEPPEED